MYMTSQYNMGNKKKNYIYKCIQQLLQLKIYHYPCFSHLNIHHLTPSIFQDKQYDVYNINDIKTKIIFR